MNEDERSSQERFDGRRNATRPAPSNRTDRPPASPFPRFSVYYRSLRDLCDLGEFTSGPSNRTDRPPSSPFLRFSVYYRSLCDLCDLGEFTSGSVATHK